MEVLAIVVLVLSVLLGLMFTVFAILNGLGDLPSNPFGSFGVRFIYEMDKVMGGQLGIPHYSKVEALLLAVACMGAWIAVFTNGLLLPCIGFLCGTVYMLVCALYGYFTGTGAAPFVVFAALNFVCLYGKLSELMQLVSSDTLAAAAVQPRFASSGTPQGDLLIVEISSAAMACLVLLSAVIMNARNTEERVEFNKRFCRIKQWCDENAGFVWLPGKDAPEDFDESALLGQ